MNIKEAKQQIENAMRSYFTKDEFGKYIIPVERQRPIFLMGPPGIGKTAIMEQVASDLGVGLVSQLQRIADIQLESRKAFHEIFLFPYYQLSAQGYLADRRT